MTGGEWIKDSHQETMLYPEEPHSTMFELLSYENQWFLYYWYPNIDVRWGETHNNLTWIYDTVDEAKQDVARILGGNYVDKD